MIFQSEDEEGVGWMRGGCPLKRISQRILGIVLETLVNKTNGFVRPPHRYDATSLGVTYFLTL